MNHLQLIIKREYLNKIRNRSFILMTFLSPIIMVLIFTLVAYLSQLNNESVNAINILDESGLFANSFEDSESVNYTNLENISLNEAKLVTETSEVYGLLYIPKALALDGFSESIIFYSDASPSISMMGSIENEIENRVNILKLEESGIDAKKIKELRIDIDAKIETFEGKKTSKLGAGLKLIFGVNCRLFTFYVYHYLR